MLHVAVPSSETRIMEYFGFDEDVLPKVVLADMRNNGMKKYMFEGAAITTDAIVQFEADFFAKKLKPSLKSEEPSKADDAEDELLLVTQKGTVVRQRVSAISEQGRQTLGVEHQRALGRSSWGNSVRAIYRVLLALLTLAGRTFHTDLLLNILLASARLPLSAVLCFGGVFLTLRSSSPRSGLLRGWLPEERRDGLLGHVPAR